MFLFSTDSICTQQDPTATAAVVGNHANLVGHKTHVSDPSLLVNSQEYHTASSSEVYWIELYAMRTLDEKIG
jgi:hypothetical protein